MKTDLLCTFENLMELCREDRSPFDFQDFVNECGGTYRIFNYRSASLLDFERPGALECRGPMFWVDPDVPLLVSRPFEKFFNYGELIGWKKYDRKYLVSNIDRIEDKHDGSLIRTFVNSKGKVQVATKGSLHSEQAIEAQIYFDEHYADVFTPSFCRDNTVLFEWTSPANRIVLKYKRSKLRFLAIRNHEGHYVQPFQNPVSIEDYGTSNMGDFVDAVHNFTDDIEGFVCVLNNGMRFKIKTQKYVDMHNNMDGVKDVKSLINMIFTETIDDFRANFFEYPDIIDDINVIEHYVLSELRRLTEIVTSTCFDNCELSRKDFAIKMKKEHPELFGLIMAKWTGKEPDYERFIIKNKLEHIKSLVEKEEK